MRQISGILFLALYIVGMLRPVLPYIDYALNKDHIATTHCINQDKPELKCNGQCYLMQQLKAMSAEQDADYPAEVPPALSVEEVLAAHLVNSFTCCRIQPEQQAQDYPDEILHLVKVYLTIPVPPPRLS